MNSKCICCSEIGIIAYVYIMITIRNIMDAFSTNVVIVCSLRVLYVVSFNVSVVVSVVVVADMVAC